MEVQYIFIKKPKSTVSTKNSNALFQNMFKTIFENITFDTFQVTIDNILETISFKSSTVNEGLTYLTVSVENKPASCAKILSIVNNLLICGKHRKDFYIINSYDGASEYYCEKLSPRFGKFERLMRLFIYTSLTKSLGIEWYETSFTEEIKAAIKDKGNVSETDLLERGLYEMTFAQLYDYLFKEFSYCSADVVVYEQLLSRDLDEMDKTEIISLLNSCKKENLWKRFFDTATFDLEEPLLKMRIYRNKVAHNKFITYEEYNDCKKNLQKINSTLENAIKQLNSDIYTEKHLTDTVMSFVALFAGLLKTSYDIVSAVQKNFSVLGKAFIKAFEPYASISKMTTMYKIGSAFLDIQRISSELESKEVHSERKTIGCDPLEQHDDSVVLYKDVEITDIDGVDDKMQNKS